METLAVPFPFFSSAFKYNQRNWGTYQRLIGGRNGQSPRIDEVLFAKSYTKVDEKQEGGG
jgi:hypothetical protein